MPWDSKLWLIFLILAERTDISMFLKVTPYGRSFFGGKPAFPFGTRGCLRNLVRIRITLTSQMAEDYEVTLSWFLGNTSQASVENPHHHRPPWDFELYSWGNSRPSSSLKSVSLSSSWAQIVKKYQGIWRRYEEMKVSRNIKPLAVRLQRTSRLSLWPNAIYSSF